MSERRGGRVAWIIGGVIALAVLAALALQLSIWRNGPAVLDTLDRISGGKRGTQELARARTGENPAQRLIVHGPADAHGEEPRPVLLFVHGGSWNKGRPDDYGFIARAFVPEGFLVVLAGYRLHPEGQYPAMIEDTAAAIAWTQRNIARHGGDPTRIVLAGHSAGAYNVVMAALERRWLEQAGGRHDAIAGLIALAGPYDFYPFDSDSTRAAFGKAGDPQATQPVNHVRRDAPPLLPVHGARDTLVKPRNSRELYRRIHAAGGRASLLVADRMNHNDPLLALASPWRQRGALFAQLRQFARDSAASVPVQDEIG